MHLSLLFLLLVIAAVGLISYLLIRFVPMPEIFKNIIIAVSVIGLIIWVLQATGLLHYLSTVKI